MCTEETQVLEKEEEGLDVHMKLTVNPDDDSLTKHTQGVKVANDIKQASLKCFYNGQKFIIIMEH